MAKYLILLALDEEENAGIIELMAALEKCFKDVKVRHLLEVETDNNLLTPMLMALSWGLNVECPLDAAWFNAVREAQ